LLEVRDLKKIYKTKNGAPVHALDGVTLTFPEKGMVFLLGKSGSGKSTLLNVCGGLDNPTSGEVIVKGRSSKDFSQSDFDSYRNTFVGFIFQEYNILNEFSVEDNIALALELQGKSKDKAAINALLEEVDLTGYAKRKPNTLSGGQKQRIAIARALVKKPEIIMADEPTGALDSATGKQVFDTLKKLSRDKLVIVVSHDRDFAEQYGDRIIELKDGKVLSDVSKSHDAAQELSGNVSRVGEVLCIKKGTELTENDFESIKAFLKTSDSDVVIASDEKSVKTFKTAARITEAGEMEVFRDTTSQNTRTKQYTKEESRFIRSKLPARHAFKIGVSGLKYKPFRLFFTILLCTVAFVMLGMLSTLSFYNSKATFYQTMRDADVSSLRLHKVYKLKEIYYNYGEKEGTYEYTGNGLFSQAEVDELRNQLNDSAFGGLSVYSSFNIRSGKGNYWQNEASAFAALQENNPLRDQVNGEYPKGKNEILLSSYHAQMLMECGGIDSEGKELDVDSVDKLIGKEISLSGREVVITGILNTGEIPYEYDILKEDTSDYSLLNRYYQYLNSSLHTVVFVSQELMDDFAKEYQYYNGYGSYYAEAGYAQIRNGEYELPADYSNTQYASVANMNAKAYFLSDSTELKEGQILFSLSHLADFVRMQLDSAGEEFWNDPAYEEVNRLQELSYWISDGGKYVYDEEKQEENFIPMTDAEYEEAVNECIALLKKYAQGITVAMQPYDSYNGYYIADTLKTYEVVGFYLRSMGEHSYECYISEADFDTLWEKHWVTMPYYSEYTSDYQDAPDAVFDQVYLPGNVEENAIDAIWEIYSNKNFDANSARVTVSGSTVDTLRMVDELVKSLSQVFLYAGLVMAAFAALLLSNFIAVSISHKKREIGILRAVGARGMDVFKIFFSESCVIGVICVAISTAVSFMLCNILNQEYGANLLGASVFVFGIASFACLIGIALVTIVIATFWPVFTAARKKPVDSIRAI